MAASTEAAAQAQQQLPREQITLHPEERRNTVIQVIRSARQRLILSLFRCNDYPILDELAEARLRGVRVEALLTPRAKDEEGRRLNELGTVLEGMGVEVYRYRDPVVKYHAKYMVADDGPAMVGTLNFTSKCFTNTCDFQLVTYDREVVSGLQRLFETDCVSPEAPLPGNLSERLVIGPDRARAQLTRLLQQAQRSLCIIDHKIADPAVISELKAQRARGVAVEILGAEMPDGLRPHGKMILVDGKVAAIGSIALSPLNMDFRREVTILIEDAACVDKLNRHFQALAAKRSTAVSPDSRPGKDDSEDDD